MKTFIFRFMQLLCIVFLHLSIQSCSSEDDLNDNSAKELSLTDSKQKVFPFIYLENNRYVMKLSEQEVKKMGISDLNSKLIAQSLERTNQRIEELENDPATHGLTLYNPQSAATNDNSENPAKYGISYVFGGLQYTVNNNTKAKSALPDLNIEKEWVWDKFVDYEVYLNPPISRDYDVVEIRMRTGYIATKYYFRTHISFTDNNIEYYVLGGQYTFSKTYYWEYWYNQSEQTQNPQSYPFNPFISTSIKPVDWTNNTGTFDSFFIRYQIENLVNWPIGYIQFKFKDNLE